MRALVVQGTGSGVGKTLVVAALCRILSEEGFKVAPFKAQNMSSNSYVTEKGEEIAYAQAFQALCCGLEPRSEFNPIFLKPKWGKRVEVIVRGKRYAELSYEQYYETFVRGVGWRVVEGALRELRSFDLVVVEGAGSPAELNLQPSDLANVRLAEHLRAPIVLVGDIDRGGVFASLYGTYELLPPRLRLLVRGFVINKFRGDLSILKPALERIEALTGVRVIGVLPWVEGLNIPWEDSASVRDSYAQGPRVAVIKLRGLSNTTDFQPLLEDCDLRFVEPWEDLEAYDAIFLPDSSEGAISELGWLRSFGFEAKLRSLVGRKLIFGIGAGYHMLGRLLVDRNRKAGQREVQGLSLLNHITVFDKAREKVVRRVKAKVLGQDPLLKPLVGKEVDGYEAHFGRVKGEDDHLFSLEDGSCEGSFAQGFVFGTNLHGLFENPEVRCVLLKFLGRTKPRFSRAYWSSGFQRFVRAVRKGLDLEHLLDLCLRPSVS